MLFNLWHLRLPQQPQIIRVQYYLYIVICFCCLQHLKRRRVHHCFILWDIGVVKLVQYASTDPLDVQVFVWSVHLDQRESVTLIKHQLDGLAAVKLVWIRVVEHQKFAKQTQKIIFELVMHGFEFAEAVKERPNQILLIQAYKCDAWLKRTLVQRVCQNPQGLSPDNHVCVVLGQIKYSLNQQRLL